MYLCMRSVNKGSTIYFIWKDCVVLVGWFGSINGKNKVQFTKYLNTLFSGSVPEQTLLIDFGIYDPQAWTQHCR